MDHRFHFFRFTALRPWRPLNIFVQDYPVAMVFIINGPLLLSEFASSAHACVSFVSGIWWCSMHFSHLIRMWILISLWFFYSKFLFLLFFPLSCVSSLSFSFSWKTIFAHEFHGNFDFCHRLTWSKSYIFRFQNRALFFKWVNERKMWDERELNKEML